MSASATQGGHNYKRLHLVDRPLQGIALTRSLSLPPPTVVGLDRDVPTTDASELPVCPRKNGPPKYNGVVFEILGRHHSNFYNRI